jgi:RimJ/RimL family protein N-acetyltransferase
MRNTLIVPEDLRIPAGRVTLRKVTGVDAAAFYAMYSNPEVMRYWSRPVMTDPQEADKLVSDILADYQAGTSLPLAVERNADGVMIGNCTLFHFHTQSRRAEIGYALARPYWGQGLMHEALRALAGYAFGPLDFNRLEADIDPRNAASARSLERLGFVKEGFLRQRWIVGDEVSDTWLYGLLRDDWRKSGIPG